LSIRELLGIDAVRAHWRKRKLHVRLMARAIKHFRLLPPGRLDPYDFGMHTDPLFCTKKAKVFGPIFKLIWSGRYTTCLIGHGRAREFLLAHEDKLPGATIELRGLFPKGNLRAMSGEDHRKYRRLFVQALQATPLAFHESALRGWILEKLTGLAKDHVGTAIPGERLRSCLRETTTGIMLRILFGLTPDDAEFPVFVQCYRKFGPRIPASVIAPKQAEAFFEIRDQVQRLVETIRRDPRDRLPSFLKHMVERDELDATALGNLIYMFEPSHFDLYSLWRWIVKHLVSNPDSIRKVQASGAPARTRFCEAIVLESLRLEQSEVLRRGPTSDISYQHYLIPKDTIFRVCLWEGHKNPDTFPNPFRFDPERFVGRKYPLEEYAPFGLDKRRCIAADFVMALSTMFVEILLGQFLITLAADGPPIHGAFHWEPNPHFSITLTHNQRTFVP
jgi:cytochrome P450